MDSGSGGLEVREGALFGESMTGAVGYGAIWIVWVLEGWLLAGGLGDV